MTSDEKVLVLELLEAVKLLAKLVHVHSGEVVLPATFEMLNDKMKKVEKALELVKSEK